MKKSDDLEVEFDRLKAKHKRLTPELIVREARAERSPLHRRFCWDDKKAAHLHRLDTARDLLATYVTVVLTEYKRHYTVPMFVRDPTLPSHTAGFVKTKDVAERQHGELILRAELDRIQGCVTRARAVAGLLDAQIPGIADYLEDLLDGVVMMRSRVRGHDDEQGDRPSA